MAKVLYKPLGVLFGVVGGLVSGALFKWIWKRVAGEDDAPNATDEHRSWSAVLAAATVEGALFALVKAAIDRGGATAFRQATGVWPGAS